MTFHYSLHGNLRFRSTCSYLVFAKVCKVSWDFLTSCPGLQSLLVWNDDCYNIRLKLKKKTCLVPSPVLGNATAFSASINSFTRPWPMRPHPINTNKSEALIIIDRPLNSNYRQILLSLYHWTITLACSDLGKRQKGVFMLFQECDLSSTKQVLGKEVKTEDNWHLRGNRSIHIFLLLVSYSCWWCLVVWRSFSVHYLVHL